MSAALLAESSPGPTKSIPKFLSTRNRELSLLRPSPFRIQSGRTKSEEETMPNTQSSNEQATPRKQPDLTGIEALRENAMMSHLLESLENKQDLGHYGRLVFAMIARH